MRFRVLEALRDSLQDRRDWQNTRSRTRLSHRGLARGLKTSLPSQIGIFREVGGCSQGDISEYAADHWRTYTNSIPSAVPADCVSLIGVPFIGRPVEAKLCVNLNATRIALPNATHLTIAKLLRGGQSPFVLRANPVHARFNPVRWDACDCRRAMESALEHRDR
jgi:hypothetical protein